MNAHPYNTNKRAAHEKHVSQPQLAELCPAAPVRPRAAFRFCVQHKGWGLPNHGGAGFEKRRQGGSSEVGTTLGI